MIATTVARAVERRVIIAGTVTKDIGVAAMTTRTKPG
jgi:hypothetical protein